MAANKPRIEHNLLNTTVFAYLSTRGIVRKSVSRVELDWLGVTPSPKDTVVFDQSAPVPADRTQASHDSAEEDAFALRLLQIGGRWWPSQKFFDRHSWSDLTYGEHYPPDLDIGYSSSGSVLVLKTFGENSPYIGGLPNTAPSKPADWARLQLCATMDERCHVLRDFGAQEYGSPKECADVPQTLKDGVAKGRYWDNLLRKMEDVKYLDQWMSTL